MRSRGKCKGTLLIAGTSFSKCTTCYTCIPALFLAEFGNQVSKVWGFYCSGEHVTLSACAEGYIVQLGVSVIQSVCNGHHCSRGNATTGAWNLKDQHVDLGALKCELGSHTVTVKPLLSGRLGIRGCP